VLDRFRSLSGDRYAVAVNATTRLPRPSEVAGVDYYFVSKGEFARMISAGELLEHAIVYGQEKGVPKAPIKELLDTGRTVLLRTDIQGARYIKGLVPGALTIFIAPPNAYELEQRLRSRDSDSPEQVSIRLQTARSEIDAAGEFDHVVVNDDLDDCVARVDEIIRKEQARESRRVIVLP
jgi:guanylate kinase